jgi:RNA polymerase sigma-70 factor (ECF subfamily)
MAATLSRLLVAGLHPDIRTSLPSDGALEGWLTTSISEAQAAWPEVILHRDLFVGYVAERITSIEGASRIESLRMSDLYLACAAAHGNAKAIACFEARYVPQVDRALARMKLARTVAEDVQGSLREALFVGTGGRPPLIRQYAGRGDLGSWVRSIAVRGALKDVRKENRAAPLEDDLALLRPELSPEFLYLKERYAGEVHGALTSALEALTARERNILRQHYLDGLNVDALGSLYRVHRATAARWVLAARESLLSGVRARLAERLGVADATLDSLLDVARSELDVSLSRLLRAPS